MYAKPLVLFYLLSWLLEYPAHNAQPGQYQQAVKLLPAGEIHDLLALHGKYLTAVRHEQQAAAYVAAFDFNAKTSLWLSAGLYQEERRRGRVLAELKDLYELAGVDMATSELPDYLPLVLEFIAVADYHTGEAVLAKLRLGLEKLLAGVKEDNSPYLPVIQACVLATRPEAYRLQVQEGIRL